MSFDHVDLVAYVPVVHAGYRKLFEECRGGLLWIVGTELLARWPKLERDIRALSPEREIVPMVLALRIFRDVLILDNNTLADWSGRVRAYNGNYRIVMPDESEMREIHDSHFSAYSVEFRSIFLRWDRTFSEKTRMPSSKNSISLQEFDRRFMMAGYSLAEKSPDWWRQVGALVVRDGALLVCAWNEHFPDRRSVYVNGDPRSNFDAGERTDLSCALHAERNVIALAARDGISLRGANLYVTTFPCPSCARAIVVAGIHRVCYVEGYSMLDAEEVLAEAGVEIVNVLLE